MLKRMQQKSGLDEKKHTGACIQWDSVLQSFMGSLKYTRRTPPKAHSSKQGFGYLWGDYSQSRHPQTPCRQIIASYTQHFVEQIKDIILGLGEHITSYDVTSLFT